MALFTDIKDLTGHRFSALHYVDHSGVKTRSLALRNGLCFDCDKGVIFFCSFCFGCTE